MKPARKIGAESSETRAAILDATEQLILDKGYAAVSSRQVAKRLELTPALIHYYFPTTDDLLVAVFRRTADNAVASLAAAFESENPLRALWAFSTNSSSTAIIMEFMAMANHRKQIRSEIASAAVAFRTMQSQALSRLSLAEPGLNPLSLTVMIMGISRLLVIEKGLGISLGHDEIRGFMDGWVNQLAED